MNQDEYAKLLATNLVVRLLLTELVSAPETEKLVLEAKRNALQSVAQMSSTLGSSGPDGWLVEKVHDEVAQMFSLVPINRQ